MSGFTVISLFNADDKSMADRQVAPTIFSRCAPADVRRRKAVVFARPCGHKLRASSAMQAQKPERWKVFGASLKATRKSRGDTRSPDFIVLYRFTVFLTVKLSKNQRGSPKSKVAPLCAALTSRSARSSTTPDSSQREESTCAWGRQGRMGRGGTRPYQGGMKDLDQIPAFFNVKAISDFLCGQISGNAHANRCVHQAAS